MGTIHRTALMEPDSPSAPKAHNPKLETDNPKPAPLNPSPVRWQLSMKERYAP